MTKKKFSPSGRYYVTTESIPTKPGAWSHTRARIYRADATESEPFIEFTRNYSSMWMTWIENHPVTGNDYLLTGEDYQGQTIINLTTGVKRSWLPAAAAKGFGWCIVRATWLPEHCWVRAEGCYWAHPYENRFLDLSDPDNVNFEQQGWFDLTRDISVDDDATIVLQPDKTLVETHVEPKFKPTGEWHYEIGDKETELHRLRYIAEKTKSPEDEQAWKTATAQHEAIYGDEGPNSKSEKWEFIPIVKFTYTLNADGVYELQSEWKHDVKLIWDKENELAEAKQAQEIAQLKENDVFYTELNKLAQQLGTKLYCSTWGQSQRDRWDGNPNVHSFSASFAHLYPERPNKERRATIKWGCVDGLLQLHLDYLPERTVQEFERSLTGWQQLIETATAWVQQP